MRCSVVGVSPVAASNRRRSWRSEMEQRGGHRRDAGALAVRQPPDAFGDHGVGGGRVGKSLAHGSLQLRRRLLGGARAGNELLKRLASVAPELVGIEGEIDEI